VRNYGNDTLRALNTLSAPFLDTPEGVSDDSLLTPRGEMVIASEEELPLLEDYLQGAQGVERLDAAQAAELVPILRRDKIAGAAIERDAQDIDVDRMLSGYLRQFRARGGEVLLKAPVQGLTRRDGLWQIDTPQGQFQAPVVINAAGAWAQQVGQMAGALPIQITPKRRSAALLPAPEGYDINQWPMWVTASETVYSKPQSGLLMVSPADADPVAPQDAWADDMVLAEGLDRFEQRVTVPVTRVESNWAGLRSFAPDNSPVVGFDPLADGFFWLAGQGGYGIQTAPVLSQLAADLVTGRASELAPSLLAALAPHRFQSEGDPA
jgi:D-arginine dehydrogenase